MQAKRNEWPIGIVVKAIPSEDNRVKKVEVNIMKHRVLLKHILDLLLM